MGARTHTHTHTLACPEQLGLNGKEENYRGESRVTL